jgi:Rrf2 family protein
MNFSKTTEYVFRIAGYMAIEENRLYKADEIYRELHIPYRYLRKLLTSLTKNNIINSVQGKKGGYFIARDLNGITLLDLINATGENPISNNCFFGFANCALQKKCVMHDKWTALRKTMLDILANTSLAELRNNGPIPYHQINN